MWCEGIRGEREKGARMEGICSTILSSKIASLW